MLASSSQAIQNTWRAFAMQWRIQDFPEEGTLTPKGAPTYYLANFSRKLHENEDILGQRGHEGRAPPLDPPLQWMAKRAIQKT